MEPRVLLIQGFLRSAARFPDRAALEVDDAVLTYSMLRRIAGALATTISREDAVSSPFVGILAHKSLTAYSGILATLLAGKAYVPMQPRNPADRLALSVSATDCRVLVVGCEAMPVLDALLTRLSWPVVVIAPLCAEDAALPSKHPRHRFVFKNGVAPGTDFDELLSGGEDDLAYVILTSGSTGEPKAVPVSNGNVIAFVDNMLDRFGPRETDRFSQIADLTFDLSVFPLWLSWESGACLCCVPESARWAPAKYVRDKQITVWTSVPSALMVMRRLRLLRPGSMPSVRYSMFCGEALPQQWVADWQLACPDSVVDNLYGPTECTCAILGYRWDQKRSPAECNDGIVPIGLPFPGQRAIVVDAASRPVPDGQLGELCLSGSQVTKGYLGRRELTEGRYGSLPGQGAELWYRTGDLARMLPSGQFGFAGRADHQVKILGHRIELAEVERAVASAAGSDAAVCLPWPMVDGMPQALVAFVGGCEIDEAEVLEGCRAKLAPYMIPARVHRLDMLPLNANGKVDRGVLARNLRDRKYE